MRIQHNIMAMNAYRNYTNNVSAMKGNLEKLSSGYKINRAGDDAAGLAISEKMRAQITGLKQAQNNAKSGINLLQTAEGALQEVQDMLNRMVKLAEQSANGTYDDGVDRNQLQKEFDRLKEEINRIDQAANFNGKALFGGPAETDPTSLNDGIETYGDGDSQLSVTGTAGASITVKDAVGGTAGVFESGDLSSLDQAAVSGKKIDGVDVTWNTNADKTMAAFVSAYNATDGKDYTASYDSSTHKLTLTANEKKVISADPSTNVTGATFTATVTGANPTTAAVTMNASGLDKTKILAAAPSAANGDKITISLNTTDKKLELKVGNTVVGTAAVADSNTETEFTFKTADATPVDLGKVKFSAAIANNDTISGIETGLSIKSGGGNNDVETVSTELQAAGVDFANASATLNAAGISAIRGLGTIKVGGEVDVDLSNISLSTQNTGKDAAIAILRMAKDAVDAWNTANGETKGYTYENVRISSDAAGNNIIAQALGDKAYLLADKTPLDDTPTPGTGQSFTFQVGDTADSYNKITVTINAINSASIKDISEGTDKTLDDLDISEEDPAGEALKALKGMVNYISDIRGDLGAAQNRLTHTINNLSVMEENIQDAESTIRDTDVADEMMAYTKNNILIQSAQAMLAQANQVPQGVLQLLQ